jgi:hypothetical protein
LGNEHRHTDIDLIFVDGHHMFDNPHKDIHSSRKIKPRYILADNIELTDVRHALKVNYKMFDVKYDPKYYFYTNEKYSSEQGYMARSPGIMGLFKMEGNYDNF